ncbi:unnamed protein product [Ostreobium quekettii]|uniref:Uncharacterized protein n=1 Tax=Ostreobium quekettii TaxID=121088 RepID=A0A8S1JB16_9CHLO|nr:unnamed protein product [Ostreobium quekettii]|eukprot:evm.model.scf_30EXC.10 EVM.evm.TU.scf_30EXC.10   scf_30EXC:201340-201645(-)
MSGFKCSDLWFHTAENRAWLVPWLKESCSRVLLVPVSIDRIISEFLWIVPEDCQQNTVAVCPAVPPPLDTCDPNSSPELACCCLDFVAVLECHQSAANVVL